MHRNPSFRAPATATAHSSDAAMQALQEGLEKTEGLRKVGENNHVGPGCPPPLRIRTTSS